MSDVKDVTPTVFGLIIAYVLPGLFTIFTIALYSTEVAKQLTSFSNAQSTVGLFFIVLLASLLAGMQLHALRWLLFQKLIYGKYEIDKNWIKQLSKPEIASSFRVVVDECYRYHQFFGAQVFVLPFFCFGLSRILDLTCLSGGLMIALFIIVEVAVWLAACTGLKQYIERANIVLKGD